MRPNIYYWPPTTPLRDLQCPVAVTKLTLAQLLSPIVAARWAAWENFHFLVVSCQRSYRRAHCKESKDGEHSSSSTKGDNKAPMEPGTQMPSESENEWIHIHRSAAEAATASQKAKTPSKKGAGSSAGQGGSIDTKSSASSMTNSGSGKGASVQERRLGCLKSLVGSFPTKFPNFQCQTPVSVPSHKPLVNLISTSNQKKGS